eukprot:14984660-Alexandrium_andersonii.AAC.1
MARPSSVTSQTSLLPSLREVEAPSWSATTCLLESSRCSALRGWGSSLSCECRPAWPEMCVVGPLRPTARTQARVRVLAMTLWAIWNVSPVCLRALS